MESIRRKLIRLPNMALTTMGDIGGCRVVLDAADTVKDFTKLLSTETEHGYGVAKDYISSPTKFGYRGVHLIHKYYARPANEYDGIRIEVQLRSKLQHPWATAVETIDFVTGQNLKSGEGEPDWLRFFSLMGTVIATREGAPPVPNTPIITSELKDALRVYEKRLEVRSFLHACKSIFSRPSLHADSYYFGNSGFVVG
jgi:hypothetical protein